MRSSPCQTDQSWFAITITQIDDQLGLGFCYSRGTVYLRTRSTFSCYQSPSPFAGDDVFSPDCESSSLEIGIICLLKCRRLSACRRLVVEKFTTGPRIILRSVVVPRGLGEGWEWGNKSFGADCESRATRHAKTLFTLDAMITYKRIRNAFSMIVMRPN